MVLFGYNSTPILSVVYIYKSFYRCIFSFLLGKYHILLRVWTLQKMANLFSKVVVPFNIPTNSEWESQLFYILTNKWPYWSFKF